MARNAWVRKLRKRKLGCVKPSGSVKMGGNRVGNSLWIKETSRRIDVFCKGSAQPDRILWSLMGKTLPPPGKKEFFLERNVQWVEIR